MKTNRFFIVWSRVLCVFVRTFWLIIFHHCKTVFLVGISRPVVPDDSSLIARYYQTENGRTFDGFIDFFFLWWSCVWYGTIILKTDTSYFEKTANIYLPPDYGILSHTQWYTSTNNAWPAKVKPWLGENLTNLPIEACWSIAKYRTAACFAAEWLPSTTMKIAVTECTSDVIKSWPKREKCRVQLDPPNWGHF